MRDADRAGRATILHADLDAFYASAERVLDPSLVGIPMAVGSGVVLAASYEARAFGVEGGMSAARAKRLCPNLRLVNGHFSEYTRLSDAVMAIFRDFTPLVEPVSIDEAFLDVSGAERLFGAPPAIAEAIRHRTRDELGLPISVGVARTKHLAKIASQVAKPDGLVVVEPEREREFLDPLPVSLMWGVGPATQARLRDLGVTTIGQLAATSPSALESLLGRAIGTKLSALAANDDPRKIATARRARSVSAPAAIGRTRPTPETIARTVGFLADRVTSRLRASHQAGRTISVRVRFASMEAVLRSATLATGVSSTRTVAEVAAGLASSAVTDHPEEREINLLAVAVSNLVPEAGLQLELPLGLHEPFAPPAGGVSGAARSAADRSIDEVRARFGRAAIGYAAVHLDPRHGVPDEFRELAERDLSD